MTRAGVRTIKGWETAFRNCKTPLEMSKILIGNLIGYRKNSLYYSQDIDNVHNAIIAIERVTRERSYPRAQPETSIDQNLSVEET